MSMDPEALYIQLGRLVETMPELDDGNPLSSTTQQWLGRAAALIAEAGDFSDTALFRTAVGGLTSGLVRYKAAQEIPLLLHRALAVAELRAPLSAQGTFIPAGNSFDAFAAMGKVLGTATRDILIVEPYLDEKALTDFAPLAQEGVSIRLLADGSGHKPTLIPASKRWVTQYGTARPLDVRLAPARTLHDRVIIADAAGVWVLTQSLNAFAGRSPASIVRVDQQTAALKVSAYDAIWRGARQCCSVVSTDCHALSFPEAPLGLSLGGVEGGPIMLLHRYMSPVDNRGRDNLPPWGGFGSKDRTRPGSAVAIHPHATPPLGGDAVGARSPLGVVRHGLQGCRRRAVSHVAEFAASVAARAPWGAGGWMWPRGPDFALCTAPGRS
jgi:hypothetical protein